VLVLVLILSAVTAAAVVVLVRQHNTAGRHEANRSSSPAPTPLSTPPSASATAGGYAAYCAGEPDCPTGGVPTTLRRPRHDVPITDERCPTKPERVVEVGTGAAAGPGPVFAVTGDPRHHGTVIMTFPPDPIGGFARSQYSGQRILWLVAPSYDGPILIRGWQLDGTHPVRFSTVDGPLLTELQLPPGTNFGGGWRQRFVYVRVRIPGCYAWQIDGTSFSYTITFRVTAGT
jgi:hypothetical protein